MVGNHTHDHRSQELLSKVHLAELMWLHLIITRGSKIMAAGTATEPIIFTSASPNPQSGDWGGIVLCGKASYQYKL